MGSKDTGRWQRLLHEHDGLRRWHRSLARRHKSTADNYLRNLGRTLDTKGERPWSILEKSQKEVDDLADDLIDDLLKRGLVPSTVGVFRKALASWLQWNDRKLSDRVRVPDVHRSQTKRRQRVPAPEELRATLHAADARQRVAISFVALAGQRPQVLGNYEATDGLCLRDLVELRIEADRVVIESVPMRFQVPASLSKTGQPYFAFLGQEGCAYLQAYFQERLAAGERLDPDSPVVRPRRGRRRFLRSCLVTRELMRPAMDAAGLRDQAPYVFRSYYSSHCMLAESEGWLRDWKDFCMGHTNDISRTYNMAKQLPPQFVESMRAAFTHAARHLESPAFNQEDPAKRMASLVLAAAGYEETELADLDVASTSDEELVGLLRARLQPAAGPIQRIVPLAELDGAVAQGWCFKAMLPDGRAVVESSSPGQNHAQVGLKLPGGLAAGQ